MNPLLMLAELRQSFWLDFISRDLLDSGALERLVRDDGLRGVTSNPAIFERAITSGGGYADDLRGLGRRGDIDAKQAYEELAIRDVRRAADVMRPVHDRTDRRDGYVSLEVAPSLARDATGTVDEARALWDAVDRPNLMIKVPGTEEGLEAIRQLVGEGINVNVTLLFSQETYARVAEAYMSGLEARAASGGDLGGIASVASFFVSRIDTAVDRLLASHDVAGHSEAERERARALRGRVAIANAKLAHARYRDIVASPRWRALAERGAQPQRLLWASTSSKDPAYRDVMYVEELIGPDTVNTMPPATADAFRDHGRARETLTADVAEARAVLDRLREAGIDLNAVTTELVDDGLRLFAEPFDRLLATIGRQLPAREAAGLARQSWRLPQELAARVQATLSAWDAAGKSRRLWQRDAGLWTSSGEDRWLGWLDIAEAQLADVARLRAVSDEARQGGFRHVVLLGMGGSSLCPDVLRRMFGAVAGHPDLRVLDSTDPAQLSTCEESIDLASTLFIVSSKSGTTLEPDILKDHFFAAVKRLVGAAEVGRRFIAITDPGSKLEAAARADGFRNVYPGRASIGGRYSALSDFGMVPAAIMGLDVEGLLRRAVAMVKACGPDVPADDNPGVVLGAMLGAAAESGRDKLTVLASAEVAPFGAWLEQLIAESTGKRGRGVIPVDAERVGPPDVYGDDRVFAYLRLASSREPDLERAVAKLESAGQPVIRVVLPDLLALGGEFFRWEIATAVAGAVLGINPFDQPDVEASKIATRELTVAYETSGALPPERPVAESSGLRLLTDERNARALIDLAGDERSPVAFLRAHLSRLSAGDYVAFLAYLEMNDANEALLQEMRHLVRDRLHVATCLGFGPRFLHSTGQAYKGGPPSGVFLQVSCDDAQDVPVPGRKLSFGIVKAAQARGDFQVLTERGRRAVCVHLGSDVRAGLTMLRALVDEATRPGG